MQNIVLVILLIIALALILIVLMQRSEGGGLGIGGGGNMSGRPPASPLAKVTWALGAGFMAASLALTVIANNNAGSSSVIDRIGTPDPQAQTGDSESPLGSDLLPPVPQSDPTAPPNPEN